MATPYEIILKKRNGEPLTKEEISWFISGFLKGDIPDYQMAAFLMAVFFRGMTDEELVAFTYEIVNSGKKLSWDFLGLPTGDKHSTGGVGDKVSFVLAPIVAACGVAVPMISGRGLGHTGGTLDKLESIPGMRVELSIEEFQKTVEKVGMAIVAQSPDLAPADGKIYALRDVTATVDSIPLIASSIMSKKIAEGVDSLVLDVKTGSGAFMREYSNAKELASKMVAIGKGAGIKIAAAITNMDRPLGIKAGNALEIEEAWDALNGKGPADLMEVSLSLAAKLISLAKNIPLEQAQSEANEALTSGKAASKFAEFIEAQGGDPDSIVQGSLPKAKYKTAVKAPRSGYITFMDTFKLGMANVELGAGRKSKEDKIDHSVGLEFLKKTGSEVKEGDEMVIIHHNVPDVSALVVQILESIEIGGTAPEVKMIYQWIE